jgi:hypothetical protein
MKTAPSAYEPPISSESVADVALGGRPARRTLKYARQDSNLQAVSRDALPSGLRIAWAPSGASHWAGVRPAEL